MKRKTLITSITFFWGIFCLTGYTSTAEEKAGPLKVINKIVIINQYEEIKPISITSQTGTTVIWVNHSRTPVEIFFLDKKVTLACGSPVNFFVGENGAYESGKIPYGGTASLCFTQKGTYEYVVTVNTTYYKPAFGGLGKQHQGTIIIK